MSGLTNPSPATNLKYDASNNVLANINAQNINPNINNPYALTLLSHQTGLSVTATAANTLYNMGSSFTVSRAGILKTTMTGYINAGNGFIILILTRGNVTMQYGNTSESIFVSIAQSYINDNSIVPRNVNSVFANGYTFEIPVLSGDVIQFQASNSVAGDIVYVTDLLVMLQ